MSNRRSLKRLALVITAGVAGVLLALALMTYEYAGPHSGGVMLVTTVEAAPPPKSHGDAVILLVAGITAVAALGGLVVFAWRSRRSA